MAAFFACGKAHDHEVIRHGRRLSARGEEGEVGLLVKVSGTRVPAWRLLARDARRITRRGGATYLVLLATNRQGYALAPSGVRALCRSMSGRKPKVFRILNYEAGKVGSRFTTAKSLWTHIRPEPRYCGFGKQQWGAAKAEAKEFLIGCARREKTVTYSELVTRIKSINIQPDDIHLTTFLGEISREESAAGRGMLTAVVVSKTDGTPSHGFFEHGRKLGYDTSDRVKFWIKEVNRVFRVWSKQDGSVQASSQLTPESSTHKLTRY